VPILFGGDLEAEDGEDKLASDLSELG